MCVHYQFSLIKKPDSTHTLAGLLWLQLLCILTFFLRRYHTATVFGLFPVLSAVNITPLKHFSINFSPPDSVVIFCHIYVEM